MVPTHGLTHIALAVSDPERSLRFYQQVLGVVETYREPGFVQVQTPGARDVIVFEKLPSRAGKSGRVAHFGFRLLRPGDIELASRRLHPRDLVRIADPGRSGRLAHGLPARHAAPISRWRTEAPGSSSMRTTGRS